MCQTLTENKALHATAPSTSYKPGTPAATPDCRAGPAHHQRVAKDEFSGVFFSSPRKFELQFGTPRASPGAAAWWSQGAEALVKLQSRSPYVR